PGARSTHAPRSRRPCEPARDRRPYERDHHTKENPLMTTTDPYTYWAPTGGHPPQSDLLTDRALVTEAYTVIPRGVLRDIVTSNLPEWTGTRSWVLSKPVAGGAVTFSQTILEVAPG